MKICNEESTPDEGVPVSEVEPGTVVYLSSWRGWGRRPYMALRTLLSTTGAHLADLEGGATILVSPSHRVLPDPDACIKLGDAK